MKRRNFIKQSVFLGSISYPGLSAICSTGEDRLSRIAVSRNPQLQNQKKTIDSAVLEKVLDNAVCAALDKDNSSEAWKSLVNPDEVIGLKVNCLSGRGSTHTELVAALCERLKEAGIKAENIIIWDRFNSDLEDAGFRINTRGRGERCFGNDAVGFEQNLEVFGSAGSLVCKTITRICDGVINLPVLKDHGIAGVTVSMKNLFGAIHNPNKYHLNVGNPYIPDVFSLPSIKPKIRFHICDAINGQYEGGPSYMPQWQWPFNGLLAGKDPVALDYTAWQIIEEKRKEAGMKSLQEAGREPAYIATAADPAHRLGNNNPDRIEKISC